LTGFAAEAGAAIAIDRTAARISARFMERNPK
jgi:hypothetical protein